MKFNRNVSFSSTATEKIQVIPEEDPKVTVLRKIGDKKIDYYRKRMIEISEWICANPESGFLEFKASKMLTDELKKYGFEIEMGVPNLTESINTLKILGGLPASYDGPSGLPTAFRAKYKGKTETPVIGFLVEYDALRSDPPFHGCQHNQQGPAGIGSAVALAQIMEENNVPGSIWLFGTPAEEVSPPSKYLMHKAEYFNGVDFFIRSHGTYDKTERVPGGYSHRHIRQMWYTFHGKPAHAQSPWEGVSALDAAILFFNGINMLKERSEPQFRFHGIISNGSLAPNVIPEIATVLYWVRYLKDETILGNVSPKKSAEMIDTKVEQLNNIALSAALATDCTVDIKLCGTMVPSISVASLNDIAFQYAVDYGARNITETKIPGSYEETGFVSIDIPGVQVKYNFEGVSQEPVAGHSYDYLNMGISEAGHNSLVLTAKVMQAIGLRLAMDEEMRKCVLKEHLMWKAKYNE